LRELFASTSAAFKSLGRGASASSRRVFEASLLASDKAFSTVSSENAARIALSKGAAARPNHFAAVLGGLPFHSAISTICARS